MNVIQSDTKLLYQDRFLDFLSHDLREPARLVSQFLKLLKDRNENSMDQKSEEFLDYAISASQKMDKMIQALTGMSRIQKNQEVKTEVHMLELMEDFHIDLLELIEKKNASIVFRGSPFVRTRKDTLQLILKELIVNSLIHARTSDELRIEVSTKQVEGTTRIEVKDNGKPVPREWREKVFEPFQKFHHGSKSLGVGLTRSRLLVEKYGGNISMEISDLEETIVICTLN